MIQQFHFWLHISKRTESKESNRYLYTHIHSSIMHNGQKVEAIQVFIDRWIHKLNVIYKHKEVLFSLKKKVNSHTCYNMKESWRWNKPVAKRQILHDSMYMKYLEESNS